MWEDKLAEIWPDYSCLYDVRCPEFQGFVHILPLAALKRPTLRRIQQEKQQNLFII